MFEARDRGSTRRTTSSTKRGLLALSHAMEDSVGLASDGSSSPRLVLALFQHAVYFEAERERYAALAADGSLVVVACVGDIDPLPTGVWAAALPSGHALERQWALVVLDGSVGTSLMATDALELDAHEASLEAGRRFRARWTFRRDDALADALGILSELGPLLPAPAAEEAREVVRAVSSIPTSISEDRLAAVTEHLVASLDRASQRSIRLRVRLEEAQGQAERDPLTGLHNRRFLDRFLARPRGGAPVAVAAMLVDLDHLGLLNEAYGHDGGDAALRAVSTVLREQTREQDVVCRFGGDEFLVLLPGLSPTGALDVADRIVAAVADYRLPEPWAGIALGVSVGVAPAVDAAVPVRLLDDALYEVKNRGRGGARLSPGEAV